MDETARNTFGFRQHVYAHAALGHFLQQDADLQFGQPRADTAMNAVSKGEMAARIGAINDDIVGIIAKNAAITIGREIPHDQLVALGNVLPAKLAVSGRSAPHMRKRSLSANNFLHGIWDNGEVIFKFCPAVRKQIEAVSGGGH